MQAKARDQSARAALFGLRKLLARYRRWYDSQMDLNRRRIEQDARRFGGRVEWDR